MTNAVLTVGQVLIGLFVNAFRLVADAAHMLSDLVTAVLVLFAGRRGAENDAALQIGITFFAQIAPLRCADFA